MRGVTPASPRSFLGAFVARPLGLLGAAICIAVVSLAPFPFGSTSTPWLAGLILAFATALPLCAVGAPRHLRRVLVFPLVAIALIVGFATLQERAPALVGRGAAVWTETAPDLGIVPEPRIAVSAGRTPPALGGPLLAALAISCGILVGRSRRLASLVLQALSVSGTLYTAAAIAWHLYSPEYVLWWHKSAHVGDLTATFTNRNTAAIFIGFTLAIVSARIASALIRISGRGRRSAGGRAQTQALRSLLIAAASACLCFVALVLTNSRAGLMMSLAVAVLVLFLRLRGAYRMSRIGVLAIGTVFAVPIALLAAFETRLGDALGDGGRLATYRATLHMIGSEPWFGVGLGSYAVAFPQWRLAEAPMWGVWERAHNTLLEVAAEAGLPMAASLALMWAFLIVFVARSALRRPDMTTVATFGIMILGLGHSLVDFSIQIPGCAAFFYLCAGIGIGRAADRAWRRRYNRHHLGATIGRSSLPSNGMATTG